MEQLALVQSATRLLIVRVHQVTNSLAPYETDVLELMVCADSASQCVRVIIIVMPFPNILLNSQNKDQN